MKTRVVLKAMLIASLVFPALGGAALAYAGPEWCDDGSPPPNDWHFRATGGPSSVSSTSWLRSTTEGTLVFTGDGPDTSSLRGGVAKGMREALEHAGSKEPRVHDDKGRSRSARDDHRDDD